MKIGWKIRNFDQSKLMMSSPHNQFILNLWKYKNFIFLMLALITLLKLQNNVNNEGHNYQKLGQHLKILPFMYNDFWGEIMYSAT